MNGFVVVEFRGHAVGVDACAPGVQDKGVNPVKNNVINPAVTIGTRAAAQ